MKGFFFSAGSGANPASYPMGTGGSLTGGTRPGREADNSPVSSAPTRLHVAVFSLML